MLSVSMIARDEEGYVADAIQSILPLGAEVVLVDTGSGDRTSEVAKACGATIFSYSWQDDFSAARNFGLSKCTGEWVLVLDCDERIAAKDLPVIQALLTQPQAAYELIQRHYTNDASLRGFVPCSGEHPEFERSYAGYVETSCVRLFPQHPKIRFQGRVHELVEPSLQDLPAVPIKKCAVRLHHYGHVRPEREQRKKALYSNLSQRKAEGPQAGWKEFFELGIEHKIGGRLQESEAALRRSLQLNPEHFNTFINLGYILTELEKYGEGERVLRAALARNEFSADAHNNLGVLYLRCAHFQEARHHLEQARELHPWDVNALCNLGKVCAVTGDFSSAEKHYTEALELIENHPPALLELGALCIQMQQLERGIKLLEKAVQAAPHESRIHYYLGIAYRDLHRTEAAVRELQTFCDLEKKLLQTSPNSTIESLVQAVENECIALRGPGTKQP